MNCTAAGLNEMQDWEWNLAYVDGNLELTLIHDAVGRSAVSPPRRAVVSTTRSIERR
jgi:hypothetical protein